jgi:DNA mismatch repair ATPase MutS
MFNDIINKSNNDDIEKNDNGDYKLTLNEIFKQPIEYCKKTQTIEKHILSDLELINAENKESNSVYNSLVETETSVGKEILSNFATKFSTNTKYLKDTQKLLKHSKDILFDKHVINNMTDLWLTIKSNSNFVETYQYLEFERFSYLNYSTIFLTWLTILNLLSPLLQVLTPVLLLILPFLMLRTVSNNENMSFSNYFEGLKFVLSNNSLGKMIINFNHGTLQQKFQCIMFVSMYFYNLYQNFISCYKFYKSQFEIQRNLYLTKEYLNYTIQSYEYFSNKINQCKLKEYGYMNNNKFMQTLDKYKTKTTELYKKFDFVSECMNYNYCSKPGTIMKTFYELYDSTEVDDVMTYSLGFHGYFDILKSLVKKIKTNTINKITYTKKNKCSFNSIYHPCIKEVPIKNDIDFVKNKIITGPNAAGKTTILKSVIVNILLSQRIGYGYFDSGIINPYKHFHCYINIPDNCSRDSLFQSEVRRCKTILDTIKKYPNERHFCVFDELYSGTNPYEAISSATSYLKYINKYDNVSFILTTHFMKICNLLKNDKKIENCHMKTTQNNDNLNYFYKMILGISNIRGGISVLKQLNYPPSLINIAKQILNTI